jgi:hypothetical protein
VLKVLAEGYTPDFISAPGPYHAPNNKSAMDNVEFLREKVQKWEQQGSMFDRASLLHKPAYSSGKYDLATDTVKLRPVLDLSRHVNLLVADRSVQLDDLGRIKIF